MTYESLLYGQSTKKRLGVVTYLEVEAVFRMTLYPTNGQFSLYTFVKFGKLYLIA